MEVLFLLDCNFLQGLFNKSLLFEMLILSA
jgi:hypothetical protein